jgi:hypothetical protein
MRLLLELFLGARCATGRCCSRLETGNSNLFAKGE